MSEAKYDNNDKILIGLMLILDYTWTYDNIDKYIAIIVISIKLANKNKVTLIGYYRQWNILMTPNDTRYKGQTFRYDRIDTVLNYDMSNNIADRQLPLTNLYNVNNN